MRYVGFYPCTNGRMGRPIWLAEGSPAVDSYQITCNASLPGDRHQHDRLTINFTMS